MTALSEPRARDPSSAPSAHELTRRARLTDAAVLDVVVPVYNEQADLEGCVRRLHAHLSATFPYPFRITVADNASTDDTLVIAETLQAAIPEVCAVHLDAKGRGRALNAVWSNSDAEVLAYMDVDLSTDLAALAPLVAPLLSGHSDLAIGTRLSHSSRVVRGAKRELISRGYNLILRRTLSARFSDAQCGFKAIRRDVAHHLLPLVEDTDWFFDTELLVLAERCGLRIAEVPVDWVDDPDSSVDIIATAKADLKGVARLALGTRVGHCADRDYAGPTRPRRAGAGRGRTERAGSARRHDRQAVRFAAVGAVSTLAYLALFLVIRGPFGAQPANLLALLITAVANTSANRRVTFGLTGRTGARKHAQGIAVFTLGAALTSGALTVVNANPGQLLELSVLLAASAASTLLRFVVFRRWIFAPQPAV